ncbi:MAG: hypothetical protein JWQ04_1525 [Pedosphaera sp.]|nr:hypothetical protein [Pedosphaera sp.]
MKHPLFILADVTAPELLGAQPNYGNSRLYEILVVFGALSVVVVVAVIWAVLYSQKKKHRKHRHHHRRPETTVAKTGNGEGQTGRKSRRMRRPHRPMNPTLAQTHGLPPLRGENDPLPPMP